MRKLLATAVALGPLCVAHGAWAETVISNGRTTPVSTSTAGAGNTADDVRIATGGSVTVSTGAAVTLDSNNKVTNQGSITMANAADGATGIQVTAPAGGLTGSVTNSGSISITDNFTATDTNGDGVLDAPFATGLNRAGIRISGPGAFTGDISNDGNITVEGNNSSGILLTTGVTGNLSNKGSISVTGDNSYGIRATTGANVTGSVNIGGSISVLGKDSSGVSLDNQISGRLTFGGSISATGYSLTTRPADSVIAKLDPLLNEQSAGPAVHIGGDVAGGVLFDRAVTGAGTTDTDGDGVVDNLQTTSTITSIGSAPAIQIGSSTQSVTLGQVGSTPDLAYGLVVKGDVVANGIYDGKNATGIDIAGSNGNTVTVNGGVRLTGSTSVSAFQANAVGLHLGDGTTADKLQLEGTIAVGSTTEGINTVAAVVIDQNATTHSLVNSGVITSGVVGEKSDAVAIVDHSGTLGQITNTGSIVTGIMATDDANDNDDPNTDPSDEVITGKTVAIDVSANTTGVTVTQALASATATAPSIVGDIRFGSGADKLDIQAGTVKGAVSFGDGADELDISGGAELHGVVTDHDGLLTVNVTKGTLDIQGGGVLNMTTLNVGAEGKLLLAIDPNAAQTGLNVSGAATFASGAQLGVTFTSLLQNPGHFQVVHAGTLNLGTLDAAALNANTPFIYQATFDTSHQASGDLFIDARRKTANELGFNGAESDAYDSIYSNLGGGDAIRNALLARKDKDSFTKLYDQLLPDHAGAPLVSLAAGVDAVNRALADRRPQAEIGETTGWIQEINFYATRDRDSSLGFRTFGFGFAGGVERGTSLGAFGLSTAFSGSDMKDPGASGDEDLSAQNYELGGYWRASGTAWRAWARGAVGYAKFDQTREFVDAFDELAANPLTIKAQSSWSGFTASAAGGASYEARFGRFFARPEATLEYYYLNEGSHTETGADDHFNLAVDSRSGHLFAGSAVLNFGGHFGDKAGGLTPEIRLGWRQNISADPGVTTARFVAGGAPFTIRSDSLEGGGPIVGFRLMTGGPMGYIALEGDADLMDQFNRYTLLLRAAFRF